MTDQELLNDLLMFLDSDDQHLGINASMALISRGYKQVNRTTVQIVADMLSLKIRLFKLENAG